MKQHILMIVFALFIIPSLLLADRIDRVQGPTIEGRIIGSTEEGIQIKPPESKIILVPHDQVKSIDFTWADMVYLKTGEQMKCKIVNRIPPDMVIVTETGEQHIRFTDIQMFYYHSSRDLKVSSLPPTGDDFKNDRSFAISDIRRKLTIGLIFGAHSPPIDNWKDQFMAATWIFSGGCRIGMLVKPSLGINVGIEYSLYNFTHYDDFKTEFGTLFLFGGLELSKQMSSTPITYGFIGADVGLLHAGGRFYLYSYRKVNFRKSTIGILPRAGVRIHIGGRLTFGVEAAYLFAPTLKIPSGSNTSIDLGFNGFSSIFSIIVHI